MSTQHSGKTALVTGASSGMGLITAKSLAARGWHVIAQGRDAARSAAAEATIRAAVSPGARVDFIRGDLALMVQVERLASEVAQLAGDRLDVMVNNAGGVRDARSVTPEGNEATFAGNHLGHFLLVDRLLPLLRATAARGEQGSVRIINVASSAHEFTPGLDWDDLQSIRNFDANAAYCRAKLANVLFTKELARRLADSGIVVHAMHPGAVDTGFFSHGDAFMQEFGRTNPLVTAEDGADTIIWLATAEEPGTTTGEYWHQRQPIPASDAACDPAGAGRLWQASEAILATSLERGE